MDTITHPTKKIICFTSDDYDAIDVLSRVIDASYIIDVDWTDKLDDDDDHAFEHYVHVSDAYDMTQHDNVMDDVFDYIENDVQHVENRIVAYIEI